MRVFARGCKCSVRRDCSHGGPPRLRGAIDTADWLSFGPDGMIHDMSESITLSSQLICDAQAAATLGQRSPAGQIEYWARLGRSIDGLLSRVPASQIAPEGQRLGDVLSCVSSDEGHQRLRALLASQPFPHYEPAGDDTADLIRIGADGTRTRGRFEGRTFQPVETPPAK